MTASPAGPTRGPTSSRRSSTCPAARSSSVIPATGWTCSTRRRSTATSSCPTGRICGRARSRSRTSWPAGRPTASRVLELGCGIALPGIVAARGGRRRRAARRLVARRGRLRRRQRRAQRRPGAHRGRAPGTTPGPLVVEGAWDLVLASDVLYEERNVMPLLEALDVLVGPAGEVWLTDPRRRHTAGVPRAGRGDLADRHHRVVPGRGRGSARARPPLTRTALHRVCPRCTAQAARGPRRGRFAVASNRAATRATSLKSRRTGRAARVRRTPLPTSAHRKASLQDHPPQRRPADPAARAR